LEVKLAGIADLPKIIPTMQRLRPHLSPEEMTSMIGEMFRDGYQLVYVGDESMAYACGWI
jgi:hypothetical protein